MRGSTKWQVNTVLKQIVGLGTSKFRNRKNCDTYGQNNRKVSDKIHSYRYYQEIKRTAIDLALFAKEYYQIKDIENIGSEVLIQWIYHKVFDEISYNSLSTYISHLEKFMLGLQIFHHHKHEKVNRNLFQRVHLIFCRDFAQTECKRFAKINRAYVDFESILSKVNSRSRSKMILQHNYGLRSIEAIFLKNSNFKANCILVIQGKGGYWIEKRLDSHFFNQIKNEVERETYNISYDIYVKDLKKAVEDSNQKWKGTHGLRYNYAQNQMYCYQKKGYSREKSKLLTAESMGHKRGNITEIYL